MDVNTLEVKVNEAWESLITESPAYLLMSNKELEKCKNFFIMGYYKAIIDSYL